MGADMADVITMVRQISCNRYTSEPDERLKTQQTLRTTILFTRKLNLDFFHQYMQNTYKLTLE
jgi:hypothetical protein